MSILEELYCGNISPVDKWYEKSSEFGKAVKTASESEQKISEWFKNHPDTEDISLVLDQFFEAHDTIVSVTAQECFIEGFKLGAKIILETFDLSGNGVFKNI